MEPQLRERLRNAFQQGELEVQSISPEGDVVWKTVTHVLRHATPDVDIYQGTTAYGNFTATSNHRVFRNPIEKTDMADLLQGDLLQGILADTSVQIPTLSMVQVDSRDYMYDLTVEDWHNFVLHTSKVVVSNSPDRNYHFRPPTGEGTVNCYNQVFGYIWQDAEIQQYLEMALWKWNMQAPNTDEICDIETLCRKHKSWAAALLWGSLVTAAQALAYNWTADEFSYSIGGISLDIDKSSKYMDLKHNAEDQWDKLVQEKKNTVHYIRGIQQSRYGMGVRSAFGPANSRGVLSPRSFL